MIWLWGWGLFVTGFMVGVMWQGVTRDAEDQLSDQARRERIAARKVSVRHQEPNIVLLEAPRWPASGD